jgi:hypothetical protein
LRTGSGWPGAGSGGDRGVGLDRLWRPSRRGIRVQNDLHLRRRRAELVGGGIERADRSLPWSNAGGGTAGRLHSAADPDIPERGMVGALARRTSGQPRQRPYVVSCDRGQRGRRGIRSFGPHVRDPHRRLGSCPSRRCCPQCYLSTALLTVGLIGRRYRSGNDLRQAGGWVPWARAATRSRTTGGTGRSGNIESTPAVPVVH